MIKLPDRLRDEYRMPSFEVGDFVLDDLTGLVTRVLDVLPPDPSPKPSILGGYVIDSDYLDGLRHPWEVSLPFGVYDESTD